MAKRKQLKISKHESGQFVKWVGKTLGADGKLRPKCWYLGHDESAAVAKAANLREQWKTLKASGSTTWPEQNEEPQLTVLPVQTGVLPPLTVEAASIEYLSLIKAEADAGQVTHQHYEATRYELVRVVSFLGPNQTLLSIGEREIKQFVITIAARPQVSTWNGEKHSMSLAYARKIISEGKHFLEWTHRRGYWPNRPSTFERLFRFKSVLTTAERMAQLSEGSVEPPFFTVDQLTDLYVEACERHRLWMLLGLNCGFAQAELDSLRRFEIKGLETDLPKIERFRRKTEVYARWTLWPETANLLRKYMAPPNKEDYALLTERGGRLKCICKSGVFSGVSEAWRKIMKRSGVKGSFKRLRKTGAWMTKRIGGLEVSEMYLSHSEPGTNKHYAGREWSKLDAALVEMWRQLEPMFEAATSRDTLLSTGARRRHRKNGSTEQ